MIELYSHQLNAINHLRNGCILNASVGTGKSRTALAYFYVKECKGELNGHAMLEPKDLYIITTARKRDTLEWDEECKPFKIFNVRTLSECGIKVTIDSWNNIRKYCNVCNAFFIFDEQRVVGSGAWVKAFYQITKKNHWILLTATPGDTWSDFIPVFVANGFYKNKSDFLKQHAIFNRFSKYPKIDSYKNTGKLLKLKKMILVDMEYIKPAAVHDMNVIVDYNRDLMKQVMKTRWNVYTNEPIRDAGQLCYIMRRVANSSESRISSVKKLIADHPKVIIFYNFDYELDILRTVAKELNIIKAEWNGHMHQPIPTKEPMWIYLVQYAAGAEGWNCTDTDTIIFYSQNYSYKAMVQAAGRINRMNTKFSDLYYYHLYSKSNIDLAINRTLKQKKAFNERKYISSIWPEN